ncbi:MAG: S4 domain-containing protein [Bacteroidales bacterium]
MSNLPGIRIDKFLWAVRIYKTRSQAAEECKKGRIIINNVQVKPSREINPDEIIIVKKLPVTYTYRVIKPIENRVSAKLVNEFIVNLTPESETEKLEISRTDLFGFRPRGLGRPTKKERRDIDRIKGDMDSF